MPKRSAKEPKQSATLGFEVKLWLTADKLRNNRDAEQCLADNIRDIGWSERRFYQKVLDVYATRVGYWPDAEQSQRFTEALVA